MNTTNPFSPDYEAKLKLGSSKYKRPEIIQPPKNSLVSLVPKSSNTLTERFRQLSQAKI